VNALVEAALKYAEEGRAVVPLFEPLPDGGCSCPKRMTCTHPGKHPRISDWPNQASTDPDTIRKWWAQWPNANIGWATKGWVVADFDPKYGGLESLARLEAEHGADLAAAPRNLTGDHPEGRGVHLRFKQNGRPIRSSAGVAPGVDIRADGGLVVVAPSVHVSGAQYTWGEGEEQPVPLWLEALARGEVNGQEPKLSFEELLANPPAKGERDPWVTKACGHLARKHRGDWNVYQEACVDQLWSIITDRTDYSIQEFEKTIGSIWKTEQSKTVEPLANDGKPHIDGSQLAWVQAEQAWEALTKYNQPPRLFRSGGFPVGLESNDDGQPRLRPLTLDRLTYYLDRAATWFKTLDSGAQVAVDVKVSVAKRVFADPEPPLPVLVRFVAAPVFGPNGNVQTEPGYHADSRTLYVPAPGFKVKPVPENPTDYDLTAAADCFDELLYDFPWQDDSSKTHAIALLLLPFVRDLIDGPTPLHLFRKPTPGTGASLLCTALFYPILGVPPTFITGRNDDYSMQQELTTILRLGPAVAPFDNYTGYLDSSHLASVLSASRWGSRILGGNDMGDWAVRTVWAMSGNNLTLSPELVRRTVMIGLDAKVPDPAQRGGFLHQLPQWADEHRAELVRSALCVGQAWLSRGRPRRSRSTPMGSFEEWEAVMGGMMEVLGAPGFLANAADLAESANPVREQNQWFVERWWHVHTSKVVKAGALAMTMAADPDCPVDLGHTNSAPAHRLGLYLDQIRGQVFVLADGTRVTVTKTTTASKGSRSWYLAADGETPELAL